MNKDYLLDLMVSVREKTIDVNTAVKEACALFEDKTSEKQALNITDVSKQRKLLIAYEIHMINSTKKEHRKCWAERTVDGYLSNL